MNTTARGSAPASPPGFGVTWGGPPRVATRGLTVVAAAAVIAGLAAPAVPAPPSPASSAAVSVIVQELPNSGNGPEKAVAALGGTVTGSFEVITGFKASVPGDRLTAPRAPPPPAPSSSPPAPGPPPGAPGCPPSARPPAPGRPPRPPASRSRAPR